MSSLNLAALVMLLAAAAAQAEPPPPALPPLAVSAAAVSPDGKRLLVGYTDFSDPAAAAGEAPLLRLWDIPSGKELQAFAGHRIVVDYVALLPGGKQVLSGSWRDGSFRLWDVASGKQVRRFGAEEKDDLFGGNFCGAVSPDGKLLLTWHLKSGSGDPRLTLWDVTGGKEPQVLSRDKMIVRSVTVSADSRLALLGCQPVIGDSSALKVVELPSGKVIRSFGSETERYINVGALSPDGKFLLLDKAEPSAEPYPPKVRLVLWDLAQDKEVRQFSPRPRRADALAQGLAYARMMTFAPDGKRVLVADLDNLLSSWRVASGEEVWSAPDLGGWPWAFLSGGDELLLVYPPIPGKYELRFQARGAASGEVLRESANFKKLRQAPPGPRP